jgi:hypothetical protein
VTPSQTDRVQKLLKAASVRPRLGYPTLLTRDLAAGLRGLLGALLVAAPRDQTLAESWPPGGTWVAAS